MPGEKPSLYPEVNKSIDGDYNFSSPISTEDLRNSQDLLSVVRAEDRPKQVVPRWTLGRGLLACSFSALCLTFVVALMTCLACIFAFTLIPQTFHSSRPLHFDYRQPFPSAELWLLPPDVLSRARIAAGKRPGHAVGPHLLPRGRVYRASLDLKLPESDHNLQLGMFQVSAEALAVGGEVLAHSTVPCMLRWRSYVIRQLRTVFLWLPLALGFVEEHQRMELTVLKSKEVILPLAGIRIFLAPKAGLLPSQGLPELYSATLTVKSSLTGLGYVFGFLRGAVTLCMLLGFVVCSVLLLLLCGQRILAPGLWAQPTTVEVPVAQPVSRDVSSREEAGGMGVAKEVAGLDRDMPRLEVSSLDEEELKGMGEVLSDEVYLGMGSGKAALNKGITGGLRQRTGAQQFSRDDSLGGLSLPSGDIDMEAWDSGEVEDGGGVGIREGRRGDGEKEVAGRGGGFAAVTNRVSEGVGRASYAVGAVAGGVVHGVQKVVNGTQKVVDGTQKVVEGTVNATGKVREKLGQGLGLGKGMGRPAGGEQVSEGAEQAQAHASKFLEGLVDRRRAGIVVGKEPLKGEESGLNDFVGEFGEEAGGKGWRWTGKGDERDGSGDKFEDARGPQE